MILEIVSPEAKLFSGEVTSVSVPGVDGDFQMLNNHAAIVSILKAGTIKVASNSFNLENEPDSKFIKSNDQKYHLAIHSGTLEMKDNRAIILVD